MSIEDTAALFGSNLVRLLTLALAGAASAAFIAGALFVFSADRRNANVRSKILSSFIPAVIFILVNDTSILLERAGFLQYLFAGLAFLAAIGVFLSASGIARRKRFAYAFTPHSSSELVVDGPYRYVRHPVYSSYLLFGLGCLIASPEWLQLAILIVMFLAYRNAAHYEELVLESHYPDYRTYKQRTRRFIPFLY